MVDGSVGVSDARVDWGREGVSVGVSGVVWLVPMDEGGVREAWDMVAWLVWAGGEEIGAWVVWIEEGWVTREVVVIWGGGSEVWGRVAWQEIGWESGLFVVIWAVRV